jgi:hypothetical protein
MSSEEKEITLVVQGDNLSSSELRLWGKEGTKYTSNSVTEECRKVVQN